MDDRLVEINFPIKGRIFEQVGLFKFGTINPVLLAKQNTRLMVLIAPFAPVFGGSIFYIIIWRHHILHCFVTPYSRNTILETPGGVLGFIWGAMFVSSSSSCSCSSCSTHVERQALNGLS